MLFFRLICSKNLLLINFIKIYPNDLVYKDNKFMVCNFLVYKDGIHDAS